jgi:hypothetical protein
VEVRFQPQFQAVLTQRKNSCTPVPTGSEVKWAAEPVWVFWRREASLVHVAIQTPNCPTRNLITKLTVLCRLKMMMVMMVLMMMMIIIIIMHLKV